MKKYVLMLCVPLMVLTTWIEPNAQAQAASATLTWTEGVGGSPEDGFGIERKLETGGQYAEIGRTAANVLTYADTGIAYDVRYCWRVYAFNAAGKSAYSPEACASKADPKPATPGKPTVSMQ